MRTLAANTCSQIGFIWTSSSNIYVPSKFYNNNYLTGIYLFCNASTINSGKAFPYCMHIGVNPADSAQTYGKYVYWEGYWYNAGAQYVFGASETIYVTFMLPSV
jgi:hypothetical protein